jgi:hypothetical protein
MPEKIYSILVIWGMERRRRPVPHSAEVENGNTCLRPDSANMLPLKAIDEPSAGGMINGE